ncbi:putative golgi to ER traffic protein 4 [Blattamonas nauphoetae]|uniref:Golgi to ER traffic protein 4 n=1 Tax=Blattamonas nauphoetae TaxID=2049346 RepID=A0ABQ9YF37_9EUKA|nr:putative golgi to ER traffic protein 4 [Blattamonas nauphoetae]
MEDLIRNGDYEEACMMCQRNFIKNFQKNQQKALESLESTIKTLSSTSANKLCFDLAEKLPSTIKSKSTPYSEAVFATYMSIASTLSDIFESITERELKGQLGQRLIDYLESGLSWTIDSKQYEVGHPKLHSFLADLASSIEFPPHLLYIHNLFGDTPFLLTSFLSEHFANPSSQDPSPSSDPLPEKMKVHGPNICFDYAVFRSVLTLLSTNNTKDLRQTLSSAISLFKNVAENSSTSVTIDYNEQTPESNQQNLLSFINTAEFSPVMKCCAALLDSLAVHNYTRFRQTEQVFQPVIAADPKLKAKVDKVIQLFFPNEAPTPAPSAQSGGGLGDILSNLMQNEGVMNMIGSLVQQI